MGSDISYYLNSHHIDLHVWAMQVDSFLLSSLSSSSHEGQFFSLSSFIITTYISNGLGHAGKWFRYSSLSSSSDRFTINGDSPCLGHTLSISSLSCHHDDYDDDLRTKLVASQCLQWPVKHRHQRHLSFLSVIVNVIVNVIIVIIIMMMMTISGQSSLHLSASSGQWRCCRRANAWQVFTIIIIIISIIIITIML